MQKIVKKLIIINKLLIEQGQLVLLLLASFFLLGALLHPTMQMKRGMINQIFAIDVTQSMNVLDYSLEGRPASRLDFSKHALRETLKNLPCGSKAGLAIFTEYRIYLLLTPVEVCAHFSELSDTLKNMNAQMAWAGGSEVAKALNFGLNIAKKLPDKPGLVFVTDGHEAPPLHPQHRPGIDAKPGEVRGMIVGAGGLALTAIPKYDPAGNLLGVWSADEVMQGDRYSEDAPSSVNSEGKALDADSAPKEKPVGNEHLSSLRESYLAQLATETGLGYHRLENAESFSKALRAPAMTGQGDIPTDLNQLAAAIALAVLALAYAASPLQRLGRKLLRTSGKKPAVPLGKKYAGARV